jgi:hypothetical protein
MNSIEIRIVAGCLLFMCGLAVGMYFEHERFLREMQGLSKEHAKDTPPKTDPSPTAETAA